MDNLPVEQLCHLLHPTWTLYDPVVVQMMRQQMLLTQLYALQAVAQEMVAVGKFVGRVMQTIGKG